MKCKNCGQEIIEGVKFCKYCGRLVESDPFEDNNPTDKKCPTCGTLNSLDSKFCRSCGTKLEEAPTPKPHESSTYYGGNVGYSQRSSEERKAISAARLDKSSHIVSLCFAGGLAFISVLFFLLMGVTSTNCNGTYTSIFEVLGNAFGSIAEAMDGVSPIAEVNQTDILGNVLLVVSIIVGFVMMAALLVWLVIKLVNINKNKGEGVGTIAMAMYFVFATCTYLVSSFVIKDLGVYEDSIGMTVDYHTEWGRGLGRVLLIGYLISRLIMRRRDFMNDKKVISKRLAGIIMLCACLLVTNNNLSGVGGELIRIEQGVSRTFEGGFLGILQLFKVAQVNVAVSDQIIYTNWAKAGMILNTALIVVFACLSFTLALSIEKRRSIKKCIVLAGVSVALSIPVLVISTYLSYFLREAIGAAQTAEVSNILIGILVNAILVLVLVIVSASVAGMKLDAVDDDVKRENTN